MSFNYGLRPGTIHHVALTNTNSTATGTFASTTQYVRVCSDSDVHINFGAAPVATATSIFIPADQPEIFKVSPNHKGACIGSSANKISVTEMGG